MLFWQPFLAKYHRRPPLLLAWALILVAVLALAPVLGQMHRVLHGGHGLAADQRQIGSNEGPTGSKLWALFGNHNNADCLLLDSASLDDGPSSSGTSALVYALPTAAPLIRATLHFGIRPLWAFQARAPPCLAAP